MKPENDEIIQKYKEKVIELKAEMQEIEYFYKVIDVKSVYNLHDYDIKMLTKGYRNRKVEVENELNQCYTRIGKLTI